MSFLPGTRPPSDPARGRAWFAVGKRGLLARRDPSAPGERWVLPEEPELRALGVELADAHYLGRREDADVFAIGLQDTLALPAGWELLGLRTLVDAFDEETFAVAGRATHVLDWATTSRFCGRCGARAERLADERCMRCPQCALSTYPRIAPAVIVLVRKGDQALLARNARFPRPFYSTLAGFSDVGETLEDTIRREVFEEVGLHVKDPRYFGSQPWPFPHSLMIGFTADWERGEIAVDHDEIADAKWFSAQALPLIPSRLSIARQLIDAWVADVAGGHRPG